jgi:hypothetical protein
MSLPITVDLPQQGSMPSQTDHLITGYQIADHQIT